ncbi:MAG: zinc ribbon domain-containing protein [Clostridiales bacterium]|nr:zinc ribbon domain-containing protein [Clostridiales bacterium]
MDNYNGQWTSNNAEQVQTQRQYNNTYASNRCPKCGSNLTAYDRFCPTCGYDMSFNKPESKNTTKIIVIVLAVVATLLLAVIAGLFITDNINKSKNEESDIVSETTDNTNDVSQLIDEQLNEVKRLYDNGDYKGAQKKLYSINEEDMNDNQRGNYRVFEANIDSRLNENNTSSNVYHAGNAYDYSAYDNSLSVAYVSGAETGNVYFWTASAGDAYTTIISNGTLIYTTGHTSNGRTLVKYNGNYGWITSRYVGYSNNYSRSTHYIGNASLGSVYVWKSAYGDAYYTTIKNGTSVTPTGNYQNGRTQIYWGSGYAWITSGYVM